MQIILTDKQEHFAQCVASGMSQAQAYRESYNVKPTTKPESVYVKASALIKKQYIQDRIAEIRAPQARKAGITLEGHLQALDELRTLAKENKQYAAAISAEVARAKAAGLLVERVENTGTLNIQTITRKIVDASK